MNIGIPKEIIKNETRVALVPGMVGLLTKMEHSVLLESGAGEAALFSDSMYEEAGAQIQSDAESLYNQSDILLKVQPPSLIPGQQKHEAKLIKEGGQIISFLTPLQSDEMIKIFLERKISSFSMEFVPRITRAQSMDALSSMATIAGYKAVIIGANHLGKMFPLLMTAAGTILAANVLVLGAGVAGLQAIATAKRLGAKVEAFDPRPVVKEQVESLGAQFIDMEIPEDAETEGGYAKEQSDEFLLKEQEAIGKRLVKSDVVITTAQIFGKKAPLLITEDMVKSMRQGSVIVDLAAEQGGNCAFTQADKTVQKHGITIYGAVNLPSLLPVHASQMYSKNITNLFRHIFSSIPLDFEDEITKGSCITHDGQVRNKMVAEHTENGGKTNE